MDPEIIFNGHACLSFKTSTGKTITCDPWISEEPVYANTEYRMPHSNSLIRNKILSETNYLYISHSHEDHFHIKSLNLFSRNIPIFIPAFEWVDFPRRKLMVNTLNTLGFKKIIELKAWETFVIDNLKITLIPPAKSRMHDWENSGLIFMDKRFTAINLNDNIPDQELINEIKTFLGNESVDVALVQAAGVSNYPSCFIMDKEKYENEVLSKKSNYSRQLMVCKTLEPKLTIPIAGDFAWLLPSQIELNKYSRESPECLVKELSQNGFNSASVCPSDSLTKNNNGEIVFKNRENLHANYEEVLKNNIEYYKQKATAIEENYKKEFSHITIKTLSKRSEEHMSENIQRSNQIFIPDFDANILIAINDLSKSIQYESDLNISSDIDIYLIELIFKKNKAVQCNSIRFEKNTYYDVFNNKKYDQVIFINKLHWLAMLSGQYLLCNMPWLMKVKQNSEDINKLRKFWSWMDYYADGGRRSVEII